MFAVRDFISLTYIRFRQHNPGINWTRPVKKKNIILLYTVFLCAVTAQSAAEPQSGTVRSKTIGGIELIYIAGGSFIMGQPNPSLVCRDCSKDEQPPHRVTLSPFWMSKYEINQKQFLAVMGVNPSFHKGDNLPVDFITWKEAKEFCSKFSHRNRVKTRLPYEAEWEYACKAGTHTIYFWGDTVDGRYCWYSENYRESTHPGGEKLPNPWGLYDMAGNVWEWCEDRYSDKYYRISPQQNPKGPNYGTSHVLRGGWIGGRENGLRSSFRCYGADDQPLEIYTGIRLVLEE